MAALSAMATSTIESLLETSTPTELRCPVGSRLLAHPQTESSRVGILLPQLDQTPPQVQQQIAETMLATDKLLWFPSASDLRKLSPTLKLALVVYLGLGSDNRMKILIQPGQQLQIDRGSLKLGPRPTLN